MKWIKIKNKRVWSLISLIMCLMVWQLISVSEAEPCSPLRKRR